MKKIIIASLLCLPLLTPLCSCKTHVNYDDYVSEYRKSVYYYAEDGFELKVYISDRETPYNCDGIKGNITPVTEVYFTAATTPAKVEVTVGKHSGEMSYMAVTSNYYLSFTADDLQGASIPVTVKADGKEYSFNAANVAEEGTIDGYTALKCVIDYDGDSFASLTDGAKFVGEIHVRLLYDDGCYYYVGLCDRDGNSHSYLVDGTDGRIIAEKQSKNKS